MAIHSFLICKMGIIILPTLTRVLWILNESIATTHSKQWLTYIKPCNHLLLTLLSLLLELQVIIFLMWEAVVSLILLHSATGGIGYESFMPTTFSRRLSLDDGSCLSWRCLGCCATFPWRQLIASDWPVPQVKQPSPISPCRTNSAVWFALWVLQWEQSEARCFHQTTHLFLWLPPLFFLSPLKGFLKISPQLFTCRTSPWTWDLWNQPKKLTWAGSGL